MHELELKNAKLSIYYPRQGNTTIHAISVSNINTYIYVITTILCHFIWLKSYLLTRSPMAPRFIILKFLLNYPIPDSQFT